LNIATEPFWSNGLSFGCTGCGKCCQNDGEAWLDTDEFVDLVDFLQLSQEEVLDKYIDKIMGGWVRLQNKVSSLIDASVADSCIMLQEDGKTCSIYSVRPAQCRTYPYWPRLLYNESNWLSEAVLPTGTAASSALPESRQWSAAMGGCEGVSLSFSFRKGKCIK